MTWKAIELEENNAEKPTQLIEEAEAIVIGIGAGNVLNDFKIGRAHV